MSKHIEALKLALEALKQLRMLGMNEQWHDSWIAKSNEAITAVEQALAEQPAQQQEPVARVINKSIVWRPCDIAGLPVGTPLYTSPQPSKPWVGLDDTDLAVCDTDGVLVARYWERVLREKNA